VSTIQAGIPRPSAAFFTISIAPLRLAAFVAYAVVELAALPLAARRLAQPEYLPALCLAFAIGLIVPAVLTFKRRVDLVEPVNWFSLMYWFVFPGAVYFLISGFGASEHILPMTAPRLARAATHAMWLFLIGYVCFLGGYLAITRDAAQRRLRLPSMREFSPILARVAIAACIAIGLVNFAYLLVSYPGGILGYLLDFGLRAHRFEMIGGDVTTFGYQFMYAAMYLWLLVLLRENRLGTRYAEAWAFFAALVMSIVMSISQGRMGQSVTYMLGLGLLVYVTSGGHAQNLRYVALIAIGMAFGIVLYLLRRASAASFTGAENFAVSGFGSFAARFFDDIAYWIIGKGNVPNVPIVMNLVETNGLDGRFLYGSSYLTWVLSLTPAAEGARNIGQTLGYLWFGAEGGLPPTIIGELFVNFGPLGVPAGMLLVGAGCAAFYQFIRARGEYIWYVVYIAVLLKFLFIWPKGETANIVSAIWAFAPTVVVYAVVCLASARRDPGPGNHHA
jgi:oligosaccharide repeat unit polymerase